MIRLDIVRNSVRDDQNPTRIVEGFQLDELVGGDEARTRRKDLEGSHGQTRLPLTLHVQHRLRVSKDLGDGCSAHGLERYVAPRNRRVLSRQVLDDEEVPPSLDEEKRERV